MIAWKLLASAEVPNGGGELRLYQRGQELSIRAEGRELMNSRAHASEQALAELGCAQLAKRPNARVLVGGLGMGYTLRSALQALSADAQVVVAELVPAVVRWNQEQLGHLAGHPLDDPRVDVQVVDVIKLLRAARAYYDAILLDVDNGPEGFTRSANDWLYGSAGLSAIARALRPKGVLGVWSAGRDRAFATRLSRAGFSVQEVACKARGERGGSRHTIWLATTR